VASVVLITAGYQAEGKYSHWFVTQATLELGAFRLSPGEYVFGYRSEGGNALQLSFYDAKTGRLLGAVTARKGTDIPIRSVAVLPPGADGRFGLQVGRFVTPFQIVD
jgi:hypothetical protein